jgi:hypothetical protein
MRTINQIKRKMTTKETKKQQVTKLLTDLKNTDSIDLISYKCDTSISYVKKIAKQLGINV